jgi:hypothetical protein
MLPQIPGLSGRQTKSISEIQGWQCKRKVFKFKAQFALDKWMLSDVLRVAKASAPTACIFVFRIYFNSKERFVHRPTGVGLLAGSIETK